MTGLTHCMVYAAGLGTRMRPLTDNCPKPLLKVGDASLLDHALGHVRDAGAKAVVNAHYKPEQIVAHLQNRRDTTVLIEAPDVLDTGGGLKNALPHLGGGPCFALNSDAVWKGPNPLTLLRSRWRPQDMDALLMLVPLEQTVGYSRSGSFLCDKAGRIAWNSSGLVYTGAQILNPDLVKTQSEHAFSIHVTWNQAIATGRAFGMTYPGKWADVGTPEGIGLAEAMLADTNV